MQSIVLTEIVAQADQLPLERLPEIGEICGQAERLYFYAAGRCGLVIRMFAMRMTHLGYSCAFVGDVTTTAITSSDLLLLGSGSGATPTVRAVAESARRVGSPVLLLTGSPQSPIAQMADTVIVLPGVTKHQLSSILRQPSGSLFEQMLFCFLEETVSYLMTRRSVSPTAIMERHANLE